MEEIKPKKDTIRLECYDYSNLLIAKVDDKTYFTTMAYLKSLVFRRRKYCYMSRYYPDYKERKDKANIN